MDKTLFTFVMNLGQMLNFAPASGSKASERIHRTREIIGARSDTSMLHRDITAIGQDMARVIARETRG